MVCLIRVSQTKSLKEPMVLDISSEYSVVRRYGWQSRPRLGLDSLQKL